MSFDVFLECFGSDHTDTFPRAIVDKILGPYVSETAGDQWTLSFPDGSGGVLYIDDETDISGFCVNRPGGVALYNALFEILRQTPGCLWWPGGAAVADPAVIPSLPGPMIDEYGPPAVVNSGAEIIEAIERDP